MGAFFMVRPAVEVLTETLIDILVGFDANQTFRRLHHTYDPPAQALFDTALTT